MPDNKLPKVIASGYLKAFDNIPCYNLDNGQRVFRFTDMTVALRGKKHGKFGNYLAASNINQYIPERLRPLQDRDNDRLPQGITEADNDGHTIKTYEAEDFIDICVAFIEAANNPKIELSDPQKEIVQRAQKFIIATAKIGITGLIDEATGYQYLRPGNFLELKMSYLLTEDLREWEKTFPDELWGEFGRLTKWKGSLKHRPKYWGKLVNEFIYDCLDKDIAQYLRENKPPKETGVRYHQWYNKDRGVRALLEHIYKIIGMAKTCYDIDGLRYETRKHFTDDYLQYRIFDKKTLQTTVAKPINIESDEN